MFSLTVMEMVRRLDRMISNDSINPLHARGVPRTRIFIVMNANCVAACKGCKTGQTDGGRDLAKAKCKIKVCCMGKGIAMCAYCTGYDLWPVIQAFHNHPSYKYGKYKQAIAYIRAILSETAPCSPTAWVSFHCLTQ